LSFIKFNALEITNNTTTLLNFQMSKSDLNRRDHQCCRGGVGRQIDPVEDHNWCLVIVTSCTCSDMKGEL